MNERSKVMEDTGTKFVQFEYIVSIPTDIGQMIGGYTVKINRAYYKDGTMIEDFYIEPYHDDRYLPKIYFRDGAFGSSVKKFEIQTTSYGALDPEEIKKVIDGYQLALAVVETLTKAFID